MNKSSPGGAAAFRELCQKADGKYVATSALEFVGQGVTNHGSAAGAVALHIDRIVHQARAIGNGPIKVLMNGAPGIGKTGLALYLRHLLGCNQWSTTKLNGTAVKMEKIEEIAQQLHYKGLFGDYRMLHIDEADAIPSAAQVRFLTLLDDLPDGVAVVCTSNCKLKEFEPRFQSRFQVFEIIPPSSEEIERLLCDYIDARNAKQIATFACGNVRQALLDAKGVLQQTLPMMPCSGALASAAV